MFENEITLQRIEPATAATLSSLGTFGSVLLLYLHVPSVNVIPTGIV